MAFKKTNEEITAFDKRVHRLITGCTGMTISSIARKFDCDWHTVQRSVKRLENAGKIRCVEQSKNLRIYENSERSLDPYHTLANEDSERSDDVYTPPITSAEQETKKEPMGKTTRVHTTGCYSVGIRRSGKIEAAIPDQAGYTIGGWNLEPRKLKSSQYYRGFISLQQGEQIKFQANQNKNGDWTSLSIYPNPRRIYYATATVESYRVMSDQAEIVTRILRKRDWQFEGEPVFKGTMHYGEIAPELLRYAGRSFKEDFDNATLHADHSVPEGELEIYEDPFDKNRTQENINILYNLPDKLRAMEDSVISLYKLSRKLISLNETILASAQLQSEALTQFATVQGETAMIRAKNSEDRTGYQ